MNPHPAVSSYLVVPSFQHNRKRPVYRNRAFLADVRRLLVPAAVIFTVWCVIAGSLGYAGASHSLVGANAFVFDTASRTGLAASATAPSIHSLPGGPTGQLLKPGTMAPDGTFRNTYARGQCTWYVAGRRQVPTNWGNANRWYPRAAAAGWSVGTVPAVAAIAWTNAGYYGHVALVEQVSQDGKKVYISEMNYRAVGVKTYRWVDASQFKYIY
jgi:surface antigen